MSFFPRDTHIALQTITYSMSISILDLPQEDMRSSRMPAECMAHVIEQC
jgi:hypothetical protein